MLDELAVNYSNNIGGDPISWDASARKPPVENHVVSIRGDDTRLISEARRGRLYQVKEAVSPRLDMCAMLNVIRGPITFGRCIVSPIKQRVERLENKCFVPLLKRLVLDYGFHRISLSSNVSKTT